MTRLFSHKLLVLLVIISVPLIATLIYFGRHNLFVPGVTEMRPLLTFNQKTPLRVKVLTSEAERVRGLSGTESLPETEGMLFVFPESDYHGIWMKNMLFPIDIMWISAEGEVIGLEERVRPDTFPTIFRPSVPARFVIETNGGFADSFDISVGDMVHIPEEVLPEDLKSE